jgi:hypothetical protein
MAQPPSSADVPSFTRDVRSGAFSCHGPRLPGTVAGVLALSAAVDVAFVPHPVKSDSSAQ